MQEEKLILNNFFHVFNVLMALLRFSSLKEKIWVFQTFECGKGILPNRRKDNSKGIPNVSTTSTSIPNTNITNSNMLDTITTLLIQPNQNSYLPLHVSLHSKQL